MRILHRFRIMHVSLSSSSSSSSSSSCCCCLRRPYYNGRSNRVYRFLMICMVLFQTPSRVFCYGDNGAPSSRSRATFLQVPEEEEKQPRNNNHDDDLSAASTVVRTGPRGTTHVTSNKNVRTNEQRPSGCSMESQKVEGGGGGPSFPRLEKEEDRNRRRVLAHPSRRDVVKGLLSDSRTVRRRQERRRRSKKNKKNKKNKRSKRNVPKHHGNGNDDPPNAVNEHGELRIVGGKFVTSANTYPWFVQGYGCGGALIAPDIVLTAGHCGPAFRLGDDARVGSNLLRKGGQVRKIVQFVRHAQNKPKTAAYDFGLVKIRPVPSTTPVVAFNTDPTIPSTGQSLTVMGLGGTKSANIYYQTYPDMLKEAAVNAVSDEDCENQFHSMFHSESMVCAAAPGRDACYGDSGSPLIVKNGGAKSVAVVGLVSWGPNRCADPVKPGVYSRVSAGASWIQKTMCQLTSSNICDGMEPIGNDDNSSTTPTKVKKRMKNMMKKKKKKKRTARSNIST